MNKVAVIGSNSFSGSHFVDLLLGKGGLDVIGISRSAEKNAVFLPYKKRDISRFRFYQMDINKNLSEMMELLDKEKPDVIVNFAAQSEVGPSWANPEQWFQTNCIGIANLTYKLKDRKYLNRYVHISSPEVYGTCEGRVLESAPYNPSTPYAASKAAGDLFLFVLVKNFNFPLIMMRSTNVYGPHQQLFKIIPRSIIYMKMGKKIPLDGGGAAVKSFIHIRDVAEGIYRAIEKGRTGEIYHLSPESGYSVKSIVEMIAGKMGLDFNEVTQPVGERLGQDAQYIIDSTKARKELKWQPHIAIDEGLDEVIEWINRDWATIIRQPLEYIHQP
ncbi:MAG: GDP-mannose 4,6-dehydratase [Chloroflexi bacterium]|nr:GDP-mannose 4,6-dehydratase [Chloroflexota bacterium]